MIGEMSFEDNFRVVSREKSMMNDLQQRTNTILSKIARTKMSPSLPTTIHNRQRSPDQQNMNVVPP